MRCFYLSLLFCFGLTLCFGQDQPVFEQKVIKDPDGKVYWPLSLPVYLQLNSKPDTKDAVALSEVKDESMKEAGFPMRWDGPGIHYVRHFDNKNPRLKEGEIAFPVYVDGQAPTTLLKLHGAPAYTASKLYFGKGLAGILTATDDMSKVAATHFSINGAPYSEYKTDFSFSEEKEYTIKFFSLDRVGNTEVPKLKVFTVDITPPATTHEVATDHVEGKILSSRSTVALSSTDNLSGVKKTTYAFDGNPLSFYLGKISLAALSDGDHVLNYFAIDKVGNEETGNEFTFYLDKMAPVISSAIDANFVKVHGRMYLAKTSTIQLSATDNKAGVKEVYYTINGGTPILYSSPFKLPQRQGAYVVKFRGIDNVNNKGSFISDKNVGNMFVDDTPPLISHQISNPKVFTRDTLFITKDSKITLSTVDLESGSARIDYQVDNGGVGTYSQAQAIQIPSDGKHKVVYTGIDKVDNSISKDFLVVVDNMAPKIFYHFSLEKMGSKEGIPMYANGTSLYLAATDNVVGTKAIYYSINDQPESVFVQPVKFTAKGAKKVQISAVDYLGNRSQVETLNFIVQ